MRKLLRIKKNIGNYLFDHQASKSVLMFIITLFVAAISGIIYAFGFSAFIEVKPDSTALPLLTGGVSGLSQTIILLTQVLGGKPDESLMQSILYFAINTPLLIFAFVKISKRFAFFTLINVGLTSVFISVFSKWGLVTDIALKEFIQNSPITRVLFAGTCTGISSGLAFISDTSCGGIDIVSYYISNKKSSTAGKYGVVISACIVLFYFIVSCFKQNVDHADNLLTIFFAILYFIVSAMVMDVINVRNKKISIEIITKEEIMPDVLVNVFPHSATITKGFGAYKKDNEFIIKTVVSSRDEKKIIKVIKTVDPSSFVTVSPLRQVYGNFFIRRTK